MFFLILVQIQNEILINKQTEVVNVFEILVLVIP